MNLIEDTNLLKEVLQRVDKEDYKHIFFSAPEDIESYYINYENGKHMSKELTEYDFENPVEFRKYLDEVWSGRDDLDYDQIKPVLLRVFVDSIEQEEKMVGNVELYNYTI